MNTGNFIAKIITMTTSIGIAFMFYSCTYAQNKPVDLDYSEWSSLLEDHVSADGVVDYRSLYQDKDKLLSFTAYLSDNPPTLSWTTNQKKAYLINTYNANTLRLILDHYPVNSIKDIKGGLSKVFKIKFIDYLGKKVSLDYIEKKVLLKMGDARVHFAINCASRSCPSLANYAFDPIVLEAQLERVTTQFINSKNVVVKANKVSLSKIFKWYDADFKQNSGSVINFINKYADLKIDPRSKIDYLDYSWDLNGTNE